MEGVVVNYQSRKGFNIRKMKNILWEDYPEKDKISIHTLQLDHIIPYCISLDNSLSNLQLIKPRKHKEKTLIDKKIIKIFKGRGWIEKLTGYSFELKKSPEFLVKEFKKELVELVKLVKDIDTTTHIHGS